MALTSQTALPFVQHKQYGPSSFSNVRNTTNDKCKTQYQFTTINEPNSSEVNLYSMAPFATSADSGGGNVFTPDTNRIYYAYMDILDKVEENQALVINRASVMYIPGTAPPLPTVQFQVAIYKLLPPGGIRGQSGTYPANSIKIAETNVIETNEANFYDLEFPTDVRLEPFADGVQNDFFIAFRSNMAVTFLSGVDTVTGTEIAYVGRSVGTPGAFGTAIEAFDAANPQGFPYFTLYKA